MASSRKAACKDVPRAEAIARLNDQLRTTGTGGTIMITQGVRRITGFDPAVLAKALADYDDFDADGDPHGERDLGVLCLFGYDLLFKLDYYSPDLKFASDDPADPAITRRVLTVLLATEW